MVRAALAGRAIGRGPVVGASAIPATTVVAASLLTVVPLTSSGGWWPSFALLMLVAWRLLRADCWPAWGAAPLGFLNDLLTGAPLGLSVALWPAMMLVMDLVDRRTQFRDYWTEWALAAMLIAAAELAEWQVSAWSDAPVPLRTTLPAILIAVLCFPVAGLIVSAIDKWRLGR